MEADDYDKSDPNPAGRTCFILLCKPELAGSPGSPCMGKGLEGSQVLQEKGIMW